MPIFPSLRFNYPSGSVLQFQFLCLLFNLLLDMTRKLLDEFIKTEAESLVRRIKELSLNSSQDKNLQSYSQMQQQQLQSANQDLYRTIQLSIKERLKPNQSKFLSNAIQIDRINHKLIEVIKTQKEFKVNYSSPQRDSKLVFHMEKRGGGGAEGGPGGGRVPALFANSEARDGALEHSRAQEDHFAFGTPHGPEALKISSLVPKPTTSAGSQTPQKEQPRYFRPSNNYRLSNIINWNENQKQSGFQFVMREFYSQFFNEVTSDLKLYQSAMPELDTFYPISMKNNTKKNTRDEQLEWIETNICAIVRGSLQQKNYLPQQTIQNFRSSYQRAQNGTQERAEEEAPETVEQIMKRISLQQRRQMLKSLQDKRKNQKSSSSLHLKDPALSSGFGAKPALKQNYKLNQIRFYALDAQQHQQIQQQRSKDSESHEPQPAQPAQPPQPQPSIILKSSLLNKLSPINSPRPNAGAAGNFVELPVINEGQQQQQLKQSKILKIQFNSYPSTPTIKSTLQLKDGTLLNAAMSQRSASQQQHQQLHSRESQNRSKQDIASQSGSEIQHRLDQDLKHLTLPENKFKKSFLNQGESRVGVTPYVFKLYSTTKQKSQSEYYLSGRSKASNLQK